MQALDQLHQAFRPHEEKFEAAQAHQQETI